MIKDGFKATAPYRLLLFEITSLSPLKCVAGFYYCSVRIALFPESPMRADCSSMQPGFNEAFHPSCHGRDDLFGRGGSVTGTHQA